MTIQAILMKFPDVEADAIREFISVVHGHTSKFCSVKNYWKASVPDAHLAAKSFANNAALFSRDGMLRDET